MPPGVKLLLYTSLAAALFVVTDLRFHAITAACIVFALFFIPFRKVKGGFLPITIFLVFTFISNAVSQSGRVVFLFGSTVITDEGLRLAALRTVRVFDMIFAAKILTSVMPLEEMISSLRRIGSPLERIGVPVHDFFTTMALTLKCFPILKRRLYAAYRESVEGKNAVSIKEKVRLVISFLAPLFVESMRNPESFFAEEEEAKE